MTTITAYTPQVFVSKNMTMTSAALVHVSKTEDGELLARFPGTWQYVRDLEIYETEAECLRRCRSILGGIILDATAEYDRLAGLTE